RPHSPHGGGGRNGIRLPRLGMTKSAPMSEQILPYPPTAPGHDVLPPGGNTPKIVSAYRAWA
ncbi:MAG TPA: hypothetical protein VMV29_06700, partial [Ktedonobacterales bacterium]|nr:hypothetical protein [Ktedonobacterales bacterium]